MSIRWASGSPTPTPEPCEPLPPTPLPSSNSTSRALVVAFAYVGRPPGFALESSANDAKAFATLLLERGVRDIELLADQAPTEGWGKALEPLVTYAPSEAESTRDHIVNALYGLKAHANAKPHTRIYFYFSGHASRDGRPSHRLWAKGVKMGGNLPQRPPRCDAFSRAEADGRCEWLEVGQTRLRHELVRYALLDGLRPESTLVIVLDCCHAGGFALGMPYSYGGKAPSKEPHAPHIAAPNAWLISACAEFELAASGSESACSEFTTALLRCVQRMPTRLTAAALADGLGQIMQQSTPAIWRSRPVLASTTVPLP